MNDRHEARLLIAILSERWDEAEVMARRRSPRWDLFLELTRACDVHPWVHHLLETRGRFDLVGPWTRQRLAKLRHKCRMDNLLLLASAERALDALLEAGIVPIVLKGLDVIHCSQVRFDARTIDDVDLLVRPKDLEAAIRALKKAGWTAPLVPSRSYWFPYHIPLTSPGSVQVGLELHWNLVQEKRYRLDPDELFGRAVPIDVAGRKVLGLERHDGAAYLLLHHLSHHFGRRLKWWVDLNLMIANGGFDWAVVAKRLASWRGLPAAATCLQHFQKIFPAMVTEQARRLFLPGWWRILLSLPLRSRHPLDLFRGTRLRAVQLWLSALHLDNPLRIPLCTWPLRAASDHASSDLAISR